jgi:hypothetical protein
MSHDARGLIGREVIVKNDVRKNKYRVVATTDSSGTIYAYLMNDKGITRYSSLGKLKFLKVYNHDTLELLKAKI